MRPLVAHCHLGLARLHRRAGKPEQAREHLMTATTMYREMDMDFWLAQAEAALASAARLRRLTSAMRFEGPGPAASRLPGGPVTMSEST